MAVAPRDDVGRARNEPAVVRAHDGDRRALLDHAPVLEHDRPVADALDRVRVVGDEDNRPARALEVPDPPEALLLERLVADREHLVEQQHVRAHVHRDREPEPHVHPGRVRSHRDVREVLELGEPEDLVEVLFDVLPPQPVDRRVQVHVLDARELRVESGADLDQRPDPAADLKLAGRGREDPRDQLQQRRLARAVGPDDAERLSGPDVEVDVAEGPQFPRVRQIAAENRLLQRPALRQPDLEDAPELARRDLAGLDVRSGAHVRARPPAGPRSAGGPGGR